MWSSRRCWIYKTALGKRFFNFCDENLFRADTSIKRISIRFLLDHTGTFLESEKLVAKTFDSDRLYNVVVGTSGSNRTILQRNINKRRYSIN